MAVKKTSGAGFESSMSSAVVCPSMASSASNTSRRTSSSSEGDEVANTTATPRP